MLLHEARQAHGEHPSTLTTLTERPKERVGLRKWPPSPRHAARSEMGAGETGASSSGWLRNGPEWGERPRPGQALPSGSRKKDKGDRRVQPGRAARDWDLSHVRASLAPDT